MLHGSRVMKQEGAGDGVGGFARWPQKGRATHEGA